MPINKPLLTALGIVAAIAAISQAWVAAERSRWSILAPGDGPIVMKQCSRNTPAQVQGFWQLSRRDVQALEAALPTFLALHEHTHVLLPLDQYRRQYVGFTAGSQRFIYGNFYRENYKRKDWRSAPVVVCDGGASFWGIVYSIGEQRFHELALNGPG